MDAPILWILFLNYLAPADGLTKVEHVTTEKLDEFFEDIDGEDLNGFLNFFETRTKTTMGPDDACQFAYFDEHTSAWIDSSDQECREFYSFLIDRYRK